MNVFTTDKIRNVVLLGHGGSGKTSLVEAIAYLAGKTNRMGTVENGNTISDYEKEEAKRGFSLRTSVIPIEWDGVKVNLLDTPGYQDFIGEAEEAVAVADAAVIVISGKSGIEVGTKRAWDLCEKRKLPRMFFVTEMDDDKASFREIVQGLQALGSGGLFGVGLGKSVTKSLYLPYPHNDFILAIIGEETGFLGVLLLLILYTLFIWRGAVIALKCKDEFGLLLASGTILMVAIQVVLNLLVVTSSMPATGVNLPFVSYGGNALMIFMFMSGVMLNISRNLSDDSLEYEE